MSNFITNQPTKELHKRLNLLISKSDELKFLIGFFYFSGIRELYSGLKNNSKFILKVLVGLNVDSTNLGLVEYAGEKSLSDDEKIIHFFTSIKNSINTEHFDNKDFYEQVKFFIHLIVEDRLIIRKTSEPNHSKLYLFKLEEEQIAKRNLFITGSSNLTKAGLTTQNEFNVEISDYGFEEAEAYFDELWNNAVKINEYDDIKKKLIEILEKETLIKEVSPFEAYCLVLKTYLESFSHKEIGTSIIQLMEKNGYKPYRYQLDAVKQALSIIEEHNGVIIADVVGLGKTIIACAVAKQLRKRGIIICPPGLIGDINRTAGWKKYTDEFGLFDWDVRSRGDLKNTLQFVNNHDDIEVVIIDEAHSFRNQDTEDYEFLKNICRDKIVVLLTATPFNNKPSDILSLLKLFIIPKKSSITLDNNLADQFRSFKGLFYRLAYIRKYHNSPDSDKRERAINHYKSLFEEEIIDLKKVAVRTHYLAKQIKNVIEPITIRRNRLDLQKNPFYKEEVKQLSKVSDPIEWFFELTKEQSEFYDTIIEQYFGDPNNGGRFKGAIYRPFEYEQGRATDIEDDEKLDQEKNRELIQQRNLFDFMRRLLVKRFESSFGAFKQSIINFQKINNDVLSFIKKTGNNDPLQGEYILDRSLLEKIYTLDLDAIEQYLIDYEEQINKGEYPKKHKRYKIKDFKLKNEFIEHINSDIKLFEEMLSKLSELKLVDNDPKTICLIENINRVLSAPPVKGEPKRKIVIFSEYADTVKYVLPKLEIHFKEKILSVAGDLPNSKIETINKNFDASFKLQENEYDILLCTDKISEGFNLNRAGMVINYDIPWNPVRVIQRLGRINRISKKVFDDLYIVNFFPTEQGAVLVKSREIAQNKMFMIHNTLGEDTKIFDVDEEPTPASLYSKIQQNPDSTEEESFYTKVLNLFSQIKKDYPALINGLKNYPVRIKVAKQHSEDELLVFFKKTRLYVMSAKSINGKTVISETSLEDVLVNIKCDQDEKSIVLSNGFWINYQKVKETRESYSIPSSEQSIERKAFNNIDNLLRTNQTPEIISYKGFLRTLREDILDYGTLSDYTLRRIANLDLSEKRFAAAIAELEALKNELGEDFLDKEKARLKKLNKEIIIAIENQHVNIEVASNVV